MERNIDEEFFDLWGDDDDWFDEILKLDNELLNVWIRVYYKRYWVEEYPTLSEEWQRETIDECKTYRKYFKWVRVDIQGIGKIKVPHVKDNIILSNKECSVLEHILENYSGLRGLDIGQMIEECVDNKKEIRKYKKTLLETSKFP